MLKNVNGIPKEQATEMFNECGIIEHYLFDVDKFQPDHSAKGNTFTGYNRVFAGPGAPVVDETYEEIISPQTGPITGPSNFPLKMACYMTWII